jgi:Gpi18-like mannosyltransferase
MKKYKIKLEELLLILILITLFINLLLIHPTFSDENFYFNVGKNILEGKIPYKDFFFAHPPLQVYTIAFLFKLFNTSFFVGKLLTLISSSLCVLLVFLISKKAFDKKSGFISALILLFSPTFIAFSTQGYGMWEASLFVLLSIYFILKNKLIESSFTFLIAILFRYFSLFYLPFVLILILIRKYKIKKFLLSFLFFSIITALVLILFFGENLINDTVIFQIKNTGTRISQEYFTFQYLSIGLFFIFLGILSTIYSIQIKDKKLLLFSLYAVLTDVIILFLVREIAYHYFLLSMPLYAISIGKTLTTFKDKIIRISIFAILFLSILTNIPTLDFYLNSTYAERYYSMAIFIKNKTSVNDSIFGEPVVTNYISFVTNRTISSDYLDSYLRHLEFEDEEKVIENLEKNKPKFFIEMESYYSSNSYFKEFISGNYSLEKELEGTPKYSIYEMKK